MEEAFDCASRDLESAAMAMHGHYIRRFLFLRSSLHLTLGNFASAELDINACLAQYESVKVTSMDLIGCYHLKISILRAKSTYKINTLSSSVLQESIILARRAEAVAQTLAASVGFLGSDINMTYQSAPPPRVLTNEQYLPFEYSLSDCHENNATLTLNAYINPKKAQEVRGPGGAGGMSSPSSKISHDISSGHSPCELVRPAPIDQEEVFVTSPIANIYLRECR